MRLPQRTRGLTMAALSLGGLLVGACVVYAILWGRSFQGADAPGLLALWGRPEAAPALANLAEVTIGVLSIALTVVAILVQLAAYRYTPRITDLFGRDPVNVAAIGIFVLTTVLVIWTNMSLYGPTHPRAMVLATVVAVSLSLLGLLPYFVYIIYFLSPGHIIAQIRRDATDALAVVRRRGDRAIPRARRELLTGIEHLDDMAHNAVKKDDKVIAIRALEALSQLLADNLREKPVLPDAWFATDRLGREDPDFIALHPDMMRALQTRRLWVEMKILRGFEVTFRHALARLPDINHLIAIHSRRFAARASDAGDVHALRLTLRYFNTFVRQCINASDLRSAYNVLNEYRLVAERFLRNGDGDAVVAVADKFKYYGHLAFTRGLDFVIETAAQDVEELLEQAFRMRADCHDALLEILLEIDREPLLEQPGQEASIRGVRKAQVKLATLYLAEGETAYARRIHDDMRAEAPERLRSIWQELEDLTDPEWWEVANRDTNWDYLSPARRGQLATFFGWFEGLEPQIEGGDQPGGA